LSTPFSLPRPLPSLVVGERVTLARWRADQVEEVTRLIERSRDDLAEFMPWASTPVTVDDEREVQSAAEDRWRAGIEVAWLVLEGDEIRGGLGLHRRGGPDELEIGYWLDVEAQGRGLMTAACAMATDVAMGTGGIRFVEIVHDAANLRSEGVPRRLGYRRVAAYTSPPQARRESGIKVRWSMEKGAWLARGVPTTVLHVD
jgi:RimJ/RimL family protein N-acetyltransferase